MQGKWKNALANFKKASELDPRSDYKAYKVGETLFLMHNYPEAERYFNQALSVASERSSVAIDCYSSKAKLYLRWEGNTTKAREILEEAWKTTAGTNIANGLIECDALDGNYKEALDRFSGKFPIGGSYEVGDPALVAKIRSLMGQPQLNLAYYESSLVSIENQLEKNPNSPGWLTSLGIAFAGLSRREKALKEADKALKLLKASQTKGDDYTKYQQLAELYTMAGNYDAAIDQLKYLLSIPSEISIPYLRIDPTWAPLCNHPRFMKLVAGK